MPTNDPTVDTVASTPDTDPTGDAVVTERPMRQCQRCSDPVLHRRYVATSDDPTARRSLWCTVCVRSNAHRCASCSAVVAEAGAPGVRVDRYGTLQRFCWPCLDRRVAAEQVQYMTDEYGVPSVVSSGLGRVWCSDPATAPDVVRWEYHGGQSAPAVTCHRHAERFPRDGVAFGSVAVPSRCAVGTVDGHVVCVACAPRCVRCSDCAAPVARPDVDNVLETYTNSPRPHPRLCVSCIDARRYAVQSRDVLIGGYHNTAGNGYQPQGLAKQISPRAVSKHTRGAQPMRFGVELEVCVDRGNDVRVAGEIRDQLGVLWAGAERDGSVAGIECPTHPGDIDTHRRVWSGFKAPRGASTDSTCGLHVHMTRSAMSTGQIARIAYLLNHHGDAAKWDCVFRRGATHYCQRRPHPLAWYRSPSSTGNREKYSVVNLSPSHTIEIRQPAGTLRGDVIAATVELLWCVYLYTLPGQPGATYSRRDGLSWAGLVSWLTTDPWGRAESKLARAYLVRRGLLPRGKKQPGSIVDNDDGTGDRAPGATHYAPAPTETPINWLLFSRYVGGPAPAPTVASPAPTALALSA